MAIYGKELEMIPQREVFWNVSYHTLIYPLLVLVLGIFCYGFYRRFRYWRQGQFEDRSGNVRQRIKSVIIYALGHGRLLKEGYPGIMHLLIFVGFLILFIGTVTVSFDYDVWRLLLGRSSFLIGDFYTIFSLILDLAGALAIIGVLIALLRRYIQRPERLNNVMDDAVILIGLLFILVTGFLVEGARIAALNPPWEYWSPIGYLTATLFPAGQATTWHRFLWWLHIATAFGFIAYIPYSKLRHIFTSAANIYLRSLEPKGRLKSIDIEHAERFGAGMITDFTWKQLLDLDACTRCGRCQDQCPAFLSRKPLSPKKLILDLFDYENETVKLQSQGKSVEESKPLVGSAVTADEIWACTTCRACMEACPIFIEHVDKIVDLRRDRVLMESDFPPELNQTFKGMENNFNPWGIGFASRSDWAEGLKIKRFDKGDSAEYLWFVGCAGSYDDRIKKISRAFVNILSHANIDVGILGPEEKCCGETARRLGNEYLAQTLIQMNIETFNQLGIKKIITFCPHGYNTFKYEYPQFNGNYHVLHSTELLAELIHSGKIKLSAKTKQRITFHDSCYLGRYSDIYHQPREIINRLTTSPMIELKRKKNSSFCCGAGGGRMWLEETIGVRINHIRTEEILTSGANTVATTCPYCLTMLSDGLKDKNATDKMKAMDIIELVESAMID